MINFKEFTKVGIVGYGAYVPYFRLPTAVVAEKQGKDTAVVDSLCVRTKSVAEKDEDSLTMAVEASLQALAVAAVEPGKIGACFVGSESFPYAVKPIGTILAEILGIGNDYFCADLQFACKAGTAGMQIVAAMIESGMIDYGLAVGADKSQAKPNDALEFTASSAASAYILGNKKSEWLACLEGTLSYSSDTPDFWRRNGEHFPEHAGRFTGEPAYFRHVLSSSQNFLKATKTKPINYNWAVFHSPNKKFPEKAAKILGFTPEQLKYSLLVEEIGNPYSASSLVSLANVLDNSKTNEKIFLTSYGSGAGSDSFSFKTFPALLEKRRFKQKLSETVFLSKAIDYSEYLKKMEIL